eukprot:1305337-Pleurochrysis_carterae.AAC.1
MWAPGTQGSAGGRAASAPPAGQAGDHRQSGDAFGIARRADRPGGHAERGEAGRVAKRRADFGGAGVCGGAPRMVPRAGAESDGRAAHGDFEWRRNWPPTRQGLRRQSRPNVGFARVDAAVRGQRQPRVGGRMGDADQGRAGGTRQS